MIEQDDVRYEFFTIPIYYGQTYGKIVGYQPVIRYCKCFATGSTWVDEQVTVEKGNTFYKKMIAKGFKKVTERSFA